MEIRFSTLRLNEANNFLAAPCSEEHGEGYLLSSDMAQMGAGLLIENLGDDNGMIVIIKEDEMAFVVKNIGNDKVAFWDYRKMPFSEAGKMFKEMGLRYFGVLLDCGESEDGRRRYKIMSKDNFILEE